MGLEYLGCSGDRRGGFCSQYDFDIKKIVSQSSKNDCNDEVGSDTHQDKRDKKRRQRRQRSKRSRRRGGQSEEKAEDRGDGEGEGDRKGTERRGLAGGLKLKMSGSQQIVDSNLESRLKLKGQDHIEYGDIVTEKDSKQTFIIKNDQKTMFNIDNYSRNTQPQVKTPNNESFTGSDNNYTTLVKSIFDPFEGNIDEKQS